MNLALFYILFSFIVASMAAIKQTWLTRIFQSNNRLPIVGVISLSTRQTNIACAKHCVSSAICKSYIYNTVSRYCQLYKTVSSNHYGTQGRKEERYFLVDKTEGTDLVRKCPVKRGFHLLSKDGPCIKFYTEYKTWYEANHTCVSYYPHSRLVVLDNKEKNDLVKAAGMAITYTFHTGVWMGLSEYKQNQYRWVDGQDVEFSDWSIRDDSSLKTRDCVLFYRSDQWTWLRWSCGIQSHFVCEIVGAK